MPVIQYYRYGFVVCYKGPGGIVNRFKLFFSIFMVICILLISACSPKPTTGKLEKIRLVGTTGPMSIPLAYMKEHNSLASVAVQTTFEVWENPAQLQTIITSGQGDFVALPTNSAAIFYNKGISLQLLDCSVWNILYLVTTDASVKSLNDLKGKQVVVPFQGAVPDAIFQTVLKGQGINPDKDLDIFYADPVQAAQLLLSGKNHYALLSEPSATSVILKGQDSGITFIRALNMLTEWQKISGNSKTPIAGMIALGSIKDRSDIIDVFSREYEKAIQWMLSNPQEAMKLGTSLKEYQGFPADGWTQSIKSISWDFISARNAKSDLENYFNALSKVNPNYIGGKLPDDGFYGNQ
jgi:NitT/TauT family transport system substrate-binding protein